MNTKPQEFPALTGVRAIAAYFVCFFHASQATQIGTHSLLAQGFTGVSIFFVLSGFLITWRYSEQAQLTPRWMGRYLLKRFARIYPVYFLLMLILFAKAQMVGESLSGVWWFLQLSLLKGYVPSVAFTGLSQTWSLTIEETFYFLAPFLFISRLSYLAVFIAGVALYFWLGDPLHFTLYTFFGRSFDFFVGMLLAYSWRRHSTGISTWISKVPFPTWTGLGIFVLGLGLINSRMEAGEHFGAWDPLGTPVHQLMLPIGCAIFFLGLIQDRTVLSRLLGSSVFQVLGKSSYVFYLLHVGFFAKQVTGAIKDLPWWFDEGQLFVAYFVAIQLLSILIHYGFEEPMRRNFSPKI